MYFDFRIFSRLTERAYKNTGMTEYTLDDVLMVFNYYFQKYEDTFKQVHPNIRIPQIERLIRIMPCIESDAKNSAGSDISAEGYKVLIDKHFQTKYRNCDYNVNHFFSGDIRLMRFYEMFY